MVEKWPHWLWENCLHRCKEISNWYKKTAARSILSSTAQRNNLFKLTYADSLSKDDLHFCEVVYFLVCKFLKTSIQESRVSNNQYLKEIFWDMWLKSYVTIQLYMHIYANICKYLGKAGWALQHEPAYLQISCITRYIWVSQNGTIFCGTLFDFWNAPWYDWDWRKCIN